jgi:hypothetical protein
MPATALSINTPVLAGGALLVVLLLDKFVLDELLVVIELEEDELLLDIKELEVLEVLEERLLELNKLLLEITALDALLETTALLTDEAVLVGGVLGGVESPPPPQPLKVSAKIRILLGIKREVDCDSDFMIPSTG